MDCSDAGSFDTDRRTATDTTSVHAAYSRTRRKCCVRFWIGWGSTVERQWSVKVADLEQAVGPIVIDPSDPERGQKGRLQIGLSAFRSDKSVRLQEVLEASVPGTTITHGELGVLIETPTAAIPAIGPQRHFVMPDDRTVLTGVSGEELTKLRQRSAADQVSGKPWFGIWQRVEQCMIAMVLDNDKVDWGHLEQADDYPHLEALLELSRHLAFAYDLERDQLQILLLIEGKSADQTGQITDHVTGAIQTLRAESEKSDNNGAEDMVLFGSVYSSVLKALAVAEPQIDGAIVSLKVSVNVEPSALVAEMAGFGGRTAKAVGEAESTSELK
jgi:hypothetical protein